MPAEVHDDLLHRGLVSPLRYFPTAPVKRDYMLFPTGTTVDATDAVRLLRGETLE